MMAPRSNTEKVIETLEHEIAIRQYAIDRLREQAKPTAAKVRTASKPERYKVVEPRMVTGDEWKVLHENGIVPQKPRETA